MPTNGSVREIYMLHLTREAVNRRWLRDVGQGESYLLAADSPKDANKRMACSLIWYGIAEMFCTLHWASHFFPLPFYREFR